MACGTVYMLRHNKTGRMYIGSSKNVNRRIQNHITCLRAGIHNVEDLQRDFDMYGNDFSVLILGEETGSNPKFEIQMMDKYRSTVRGIGYNYKDPHITKKGHSKKFLLKQLINTLDEAEVDYAYSFLSKMFGGKKNERA